MENSSAEGRRANRIGALVVAALLLLTGCSSPALSGPSAGGTEDPLTGVDVSDASEAQAAEISDRLATAQEYHAAFQRFRECLSASGSELTFVELRDPVYEYAVPDAAVAGGADGRCYGAEFRYIDMLWQGTDAVQNASGTARFLRECLQDRGIEPGETLKEMSGQLREAGVGIPACLS